MRGMFDQVGQHGRSARLAALVEQVGKVRKVYLHRIVDALMFKIHPSEASRTTGQADLAGQAPPRLWIEGPSSV